MPAATHDILVEQGATYTQNLVWKDGSAAAIDLTGYTARMQFRRTKSATTALLSATTENGYITLGGTAGTIDIEIPDDITAALTVTRAVYDLELISSTGVVTRLIEGDVEISKEVTR